MTVQTDPKLKQFTDYFDLQVEYSAELPDKVPGFLKIEPDSACIVVNARKPSCDHALTIAHEMAHYVMHQDSPRKLPMPWFLDYPWKVPFVREAAQEVKTYFLKTFDREWEANLWAFLLLWRIGAVEELQAITKMYPEMRWMFWYSFAAWMFSLQKQLDENFYRRLFHPFSSQ